MATEGPPADHARGPLHRGLEWVFAALSALVVAGSYLDGWAHRHDRVDQSFFTPWHAALYSGMALTGAFLVAVARRRHASGARWPEALPPAYRLSAAGVALFGIAGLGDLAWHLAFGIEDDTAALLSPTHLALAAGAALVVTGPLRQLLAERRGNESHGPRELGPGVLSAALLTSLLAFMTQFAHPFVDLFPLDSAPNQRFAANVYTMRADGAAQTRLSSGEYFEGFPTWSPDGSRLVFVASESGVLGESDLHVMNRDGGGRARLLATPGEDGSPSWSPDGSKIAFVSGDGPLPTDLYVVDADGTGLHRLTSNGGPKWGTSWSPDGAHIAFSAGGEGNWRVYRVAADGSAEIALTPADAMSFGPAWSPDGKTIAFDRREDERESIYLMDADGRNPRLVPLGKNVHHATWSPDGARLAFASSREGQQQIYVAAIDGTGEENLTRAPGLDAFLPAWSPDGSTIAYAAGPHIAGGAEESVRLGVTSILLQLALIFAPLLFLAVRLSLPRGAVAAFIGVTLLPPLVLQDTYNLAPGVVAGALLAEALAIGIRPHVSRIRLRLFAFVAPAALAAAYFAALRAQAPLQWTVHLWAGSIVIAGVVGLLLALLLTSTSARATED